MFPKPPRPEPPRRAIATQVVRQRDDATRRVPDTLVADGPAVPLAKPAAPPPADSATALPAAGKRPV